MHPTAVHYGKVDQVWQARQSVMKEAYARNPNQFIHGIPHLPKPRQHVWINKPPYAPNLNKAQSENPGVEQNHIPSK